MTDPCTKRQPRRYITGYNAAGQGVIQITDQGHWTKIAGDACRYNVMWASSTFPVDISRDTSAEEAITAMSLSLPNGTVLRMVDRRPGTSSAMHRTQSLDYGVVIEGEMELIMDSGETVTMKKGDVCIQRGTLHQWRNNGTEWNRMLFVLIDALPIQGGEKVFTGESGYEHVKEIGRRE